LRPGEREEHIWAYAFCINQQDLAEEISQICLMERIYSSAATVYIDLGDTEGYEVSLDGFVIRFSGSVTQSDHLEHPFHYKMDFQALN
jgi:hypothetical protein